ncbi:MULTISPECIES: sulfatase [unclassified Thermococcus]|uniref:sulfatase n=1 Tax=unclassified Thermococcus TaxID=2627626 RepID=UPI001439950E|nr:MULTISPECIES: sulfatase [unclassified Thermococcus]
MANGEIKKVLLITIDCFRGDHLHYNGYERKITPTMDKLAKEGSNFFMAFSNGPHTHYSFPSILTSTYPLMFEGPKIGAGRITLAEVMKMLGFKTVGLNSNPFLSEYFGYGKGFDVFNDFLSGEEAKKKSSIAVNLRKKIPKGSIIYRFLQFVDKYMAIKNQKTPYITADELRSRVIDYLERYKDEKLFLWAHFMDAHYPYLPSRETMEELGFKDVNDFKKARLFTKMLNSPEKVTPEEAQILINLYDAQIYTIDQEIKKIFEYLDENGMLDETLIVITADHGEEFGEHGDFTHRVDRDKPTLYNVHIHVPLIFYSGNWEYDDVDKNVSLIDLAPTIVDLVASQKVKKFMGRSLVPLMSKEESEHRAFYSEHEYQESEIVGNVMKERKKAIAYIEYPYKLIYYEGDNSYQLYNFEEDPEERKNLINEPDYQKVALYMKEKIKEHLRKIEMSKVRIRLGRLRKV